MKIGIDAQASKGRLTGLGVYTKNLIQFLLAQQRNGFEFVLISREQKGDWNTAERLLWENAEVPRQARRGRIGILHVPAFSPPLIKPCRVVVTVHDLIGMFFANQLGWPSRFYWGKWLPLTVRKADAIIADSENTKKDIVEHLQVPEARVKVIYPSGHEGFSPHQEPAALKRTRERFGIKEKYFLTVGTLEPRKNLLRTIEAFSQFLKTSKSDATFQLVVVGSIDFAHGKFLKILLENCKLDSDDVILTGYVEQEDLNMLYSGAEGFVFASLYEGFGIPVLEAMASGAPVITSRSSSLPEVAGDAAAYVDPCDVSAIANGMCDIASNSTLRKQLVEKGFERIKHFSWRDTANKTLEVYESLESGGVA